MIELTLVNWTPVKVSAGGILSIDQEEHFTTVVLTGRNVVRVRESKSDIEGMIGLAKLTETFND